MKPSLGSLGSRLSHGRGDGAGRDGGSGVAGGAAGRSRLSRRPPMTIDRAHTVVLRPYNTERTFAMVEGEAKVCFIVARKASKADIAEAVSVLYGQRPASVNTSRTIYGKKAFVKFETAEKAKDLASDMGML